MWRLPQLLPLALLLLLIAVSTTTTTAQSPSPPPPGQPKKPAYRAQSLLGQPKPFAASAAAAAASESFPTRQNAFIILETGPAPAAAAEKSAKDRQQQQQQEGRSFVLATAAADGLPISAQSINEHIYAELAREQAKAEAAHAEAERLPVNQNKYLRLLEAARSTLHSDYVNPQLVLEPDRRNGGGPSSDPTRGLDATKAASSSSNNQDFAAATARFDDAEPSFAKPGFFLDHRQQQSLALASSSEQQQLNDDDVPKTAVVHDLPAPAPPSPSPPPTTTYPFSKAELAARIAQAPKVNEPGSGLHVAFRWRFLDWVDPTVQLTRKNFTVGNPLTQDVDIDRRGRVFVTSPQWLEGVPITLSVLTNGKGAGGPLLAPYPDWSWHRLSCEGLVSVYRVAIDECDRLWMVDTGMAAGKAVCPMKIIVFDLKTDELLFRHPIPPEQTADGKASYVCPVVELGETCHDAHLYVADVLEHGLLVFSLKDKRSWRLSNTQSNAFGSDPEGRNLTIAGESFELNDGTLGMSLSPNGFFAKRYLYFNSLASFYQKFADADSLKSSYAYEPLVYRSLHKRASQAGVQATSRTGAIFFQLAEFTALACWNIGRPYTPENIVVLAQDDVALQYVSGMKVVVNAHGAEELWLNTNRLQRTINKSRKIEEINFRLIHGRVDELISGTLCEPTGYPLEEPESQSWERI